MIHVLERTIDAYEPTHPLGVAPVDIGSHCGEVISLGTASVNDWWPYVGPGQWSAINLSGVTGNGNPIRNVGTGFGGSTSFIAPPGLLSLSPESEAGRLNRSEVVVFGLTEFSVNGGLSSDDFYAADVPIPPSSLTVPADEAVILEGLRFGTGPVLLRRRSYE